MRKLFLEFLEKCNNIAIDGPKRGGKLSRVLEKQGRNELTPHRSRQPRTPYASGIVRQRTDRAVHGGTVRPAPDRPPRNAAYLHQADSGFSLLWTGTASMVSKPVSILVGVVIGVRRLATPRHAPPRPYNEASPTKGGGVRYALTTVPAPPFFVPQQRADINGVELGRCHDRCRIANDSPSRTAKPLFFILNTSPGRARSPVRIRPYRLRHNITLRRQHLANHGSRGGCRYDQSVMLGSS